MTVLVVCVLFRCCPTFGANVMVVSTSDASCMVEVWNSYIADTRKPLPTCWGEFFWQTPQHFPSMTGIEAKNIGDVRNEPVTSGLVQWRTRYGNDQSESGFAINTISQTGGGGLPQTPYNEKVGLYMPTILAPGGSNTWGIDIDTTIISGVGRYPAFGLENDFTNFNGPYTNAKDGIGVSASYFNTFLSSYPVTAGELWSAGSQKNAMTSVSVMLRKGSVSALIQGFTRGAIKGLYVGEMLQDGAAFDPWTKIAGLDDKMIVLSSAAQRSGAASLSFVPSGAQYGFLVNSLDVFGDSTFADFGNAETSLAIAGYHKVGLSIGGKTDYGIAVAGGLPICFDGLSACEHWDNKKLHVEADHEANSYSAHSMKLASVAVKQLPECNYERTDVIMSINDASKVAFAAPPVGGGTERALVFCDGRKWTMH